jgi:hypothetical protein
MRPLAYWAALLVLSALIYSGLNEISQPNPFSGTFSLNEVLQGFVYSLSRMIPIGPWQEVNFSDSILFKNNALKVEQVPFEKFVVVTFAAIQSLISTILIFLFGLAVRRRFQIG